MISDEALDIAGRQASAKARETMWEAGYDVPGHVVDLAFRDALRTTVEAIEWHLVVKRFDREGDA